MTRSSTANKLLASLAAAAFWLLVWQLLYRAVGKDLLVASPLQAFRRLLELAGDASFWIQLGATCLRVVLSFGLALLGGGLLAVLTARFRLLYALFSPLLGVIRATPVASFIILALIWIKSGSVPVFSAFLMVLPMVWANLYEGICAADAELLEMAKVFRFSRLRTVRLVYIPGLMPYFSAACSTGFGIAWKSAVAAEVIAHPRHAIGTRIYDAKVYLETADLFAWTIAVILLSVLLEKLTTRLIRRLAARLAGGAPEGGTARV